FLVPLSTILSFFLLEPGAPSVLLIVPEVFFFRCFSCSPPLFLFLQLGQLLPFPVPVLLPLEPHPPTPKTKPSPAIAPPSPYTPKHPKPSPRVPTPPLMSVAAPPSSGPSPDHHAGQPPSTKRENSPRTLQQIRDRDV